MNSSPPTRVFRALCVLCVLCGLFPVFAANVCFDTINFASNRSTNRTFIITPLSLTNVPTGRLPSYDQLSYSTGTNGYVWVSNMVAGVYQVDLLAPPRATRHNIIVDTNAVQYAGTNTVATLQNVLPPGSVAYSTTAADARFAPIGSTPSNAVTRVSGATGLGLSNTVTGFTVWLIPDTSLPEDANISLPGSVSGKANVYRSGGGWQAFGDSFTLGVGATTSNLCYVARTASGMNRAVTNRGFSGHEIQYIGAQVYASQVQTNDGTIMLTGYNDMRHNGLIPATGVPTYKDTLRSMIAYCAIPHSQKVLQGNMTFSSSWSDYSVFGGWLTKYTSTAGATATFTTYGTAVYVCWLNRSQMGTGGSFTIAVDGTVLETVDANVGIGDNAGTTFWPALTRVGGLTNGVHTVVVTAVGDGYIDMVWAAGNSVPASGARPIVLSSGPLRMSAAGYAIGSPTWNGGSDAAVERYNQANRDVCAELASDGLNVTAVDAYLAYEPTAGGVLYGDNVHPNDTGHQVIANAFLAAAETFKRIPPEVVTLSRLGQSGGSSSSPTNNDTRNFNMPGTWTFGGVVAPGLAGFTITGTGTTTNYTPKALWTNSVPVSNAYSMTFWATASGPTNKAFFKTEALFWRDGGNLALIATNQTRLGSNTLHLYLAAENTSNAVVYGIGQTNEEVQWAFDGFGKQQTNGWASAGGGGGGGGQVDPLSISGVKGYYQATDLAGITDGQPVLNWSNRVSFADTDTVLTYYNAAPAKQTDGTNAVVTFNGASHLLGTYATNRTSCTGSTNTFTMVMRVKPGAANGVVFSWHSHASTNVVVYAPYDNVIYYDFGNNSSGRVSVAEPGGWDNSWHTLICRRKSDGTQDIRVDGSTLVSGSKTGLLAGDGRWVLGGTYFASEAGNFWPGSIRAVALFDSYLSDSDADGVGAYMDAH